MYCDHCNRLVCKEKCPGCGNRNLRLPGPDDYCFLTEPDPLWIRAMEDLLTDNGIAFATRKVLGAAMTIKAGVPQRVRFFVRHRDYQQAKELNEAFFSSDFAYEE